MESTVRYLGIEVDIAVDTGAGVTQARFTSLAGPKT